MGNIFSTKSLLSNLFGTNPTTKGTFFKRPSIRNFAEVDYGKLIFRPEDQNTNYVVLSRQDVNGKRHQILYDAQFAKILRESETWRNIESESEVEGLSAATSDEEAEQERWEEWMRKRKSNRAKSAL